MFKPLTLSLSLAVALGASSMSMAGHHVTATEQCAPSAQAPVVASAQCEKPACSFGHKKIDWSGLVAKFHKPKVYTYEWVLKKKRVWHTPSLGCHEAAPAVCPSSQSVIASPQATSQIPATYGAPQAAYNLPQAPAVAVETSSILSGDEAPPAPAAPSANMPQSSLLFSSPAGN